MRRIFALSALLFALCAVPALGLTGSASVEGTISSFDGTSLPGAVVEWAYFDDADVYIFGDTTAATIADPTYGDGHYTFSNVYESSKVMISAQLDPLSGDYMYVYPIDFSTPLAGPVDLRPGRIHVAVTRRVVDNIWRDWGDAFVHISGSAGGADTTLSDPSQSQPVVSGDVNAMAPDATYYLARFWSNEATEGTIPTPAPAISAGAVTDVTVAIDQSASSRLWIKTPYWGSGAPGTKVTLKYDGWATGVSARYEGSSEYPENYVPTVFGGKTTTSLGIQAQTTTVTIPSIARPGYNFYVHMYRPEVWSQLDLSVGFQVCTLKASKTTVYSGHAVRLSGVVPIEGHWGATTGHHKYVTIFKRSTSAGVPQTRGAKGWTKVGKYLTNGYGAYHTGYLHPLRSTWYVAYYPGIGTPSYAGDTYYYEGFTGVRKVAVRR